MANIHSVYKYKLVVFLSEKKSAKEIIDIVPNDWIYADGESDDLMCKFMPEEIYNEDNLKLLNDMVRECAKPCDDWPSYPIDIRGRACSYEEAEKLMDKLQYQAYAYSTDNEKRAKKKAEKDKKLFKLKKLSPNKINTLLNNATLNLSDRHRSNSEVNLQLFENNFGKKQSGTSKNVGKDPKNLKYPKRSSETDKSRGTKRNRSSSSESLSKSKKSTDSSSCEESVVEKYKKSKRLNSKYNTNSIPRKGFKLNSDKSEDDSEPESNNTVHKKKPLDNNQSPKHDINEELMTKVFEKLLAPIINEQKSINVQLNSLSKSVSDLKGLVLQMQRANESNATASLGIDNDLKDDDMKIPCSGLADFAKFNEKLNSDENYRNKIARRLASLANPNQALIRSTTPMIRLGMSRDVALKFNLKKANEKRPKIFIDTPFYKLIKGIIVKKFSKSVDDPLSDAAINESISSVLNHCGDWEGGRNERKNKNKKETSAIDIRSGARNSPNKEKTPQQENDAEKSSKDD